MKTVRKLYQPFIDELKKYSCLLILKLQEQHILPHVVQDTVASNISFIVEYLWTHISDLLSKELLKAGFAIEEHQTIDFLLKDKQYFERAFQDISSEHKLLKFC